MDSGVLYELGSLLPSIGVGVLFWFAIRAMLRADRHEREAERAADKELRTRATPGDAPAPETGRMSGSSR